MRNKFSGRGQAWAKGKTYEDIYGKKLADEKRIFLSRRLLGISSWDAMSDEQKNIANEKRRKAIQDRYDKGWRPGGGRCKKIKYISPVAGEISLDGTWELIAARYLDSLNIMWKRNTKRFSYIKKSGKKSYYVPDFYVEVWETYIEVKGYETDLDKEKWCSFKGNLIIWKKDKIKELKIITNSKEKVY